MGHRRWRSEWTCTFRGHCFCTRYKYWIVFYFDYIWNCLLFEPRHPHRIVSSQQAKLIIFFQQKLDYSYLSWWIFLVKHTDCSAGGSRVLKWTRFVFLFGVAILPHAQQVPYYVIPFLSLFFQRWLRTAFEIVQYSPCYATVFYKQNGRRLPGLFVIKPWNHLHMGTVLL